MFSPAAMQDTCLLPIKLVELIDYVLAVSQECPAAQTNVAQDLSHGRDCEGELWML